MNHRERFLAAIERRPVDRPATWLGLPVPDALPGLLAYFKARDVIELKEILDDDVFPVEVPYNHPPANHIACAFDFAVSAPGTGTTDERTLTAPGFFAGCSDPADVSRFDWPDPQKHIDPDACRRAMDAVPSGYATLGMLWSAHFQDACAAFGMEESFVKMIAEPEMYRAVIDRITGFYLDANEIFYKAAGGRLDAVLIGNDFGTQRGLMIAPEKLREFVLPGVRLLVAQARSHGVKVIHHSCGSVFDIIPDLIDAGVDAIHPMQALASNMQPELLAARFGGRVSFCGGVDVQKLLVRAGPGEVAAAVRNLRRLFPTGLIISPSHEAVLPDVRPANLAAMFAAARN